MGHGSGFRVNLEWVTPCFKALILTLTLTLTRTRTKAARAKAAEESHAELAAKGGKAADEKQAARATKRADKANPSADAAKVWARAQG